MARNAASTTKKSPVVKPPVNKTTTTVKTVKTAPVPAATSAAAASGFSGHIGLSLREVSLWRALAAEFIGTFLLAATIIVAQGQPIIVLFGVVGIVLFLGALSDAHINPVVTLGAWVTRRIGWLRTIGYILAQCLGAALAFVTLNAFLGSADPVSQQAQLYGQTAPSLFKAVEIAGIAGKEWYVFFAELLGASIIGLAFAHASHLRSTADRISSSFTAGLGYYIALMIGITVAGYAGANAILNPAVAISLQAITENFWSIAVYILAPVVGGVAGFILHDILYGRVR